MKLTEYTGERALEAWGDLLEPLSEIAADEEVQGLARTPGVTIARVAATIIKKHPKAVIAVLAVWDGESPDTYKVDFFTLPKKVIEVVNVPGIADLFTWQGQTAAPSSGSAMENTGEEES